MIPIVKKIKNSELLLGSFWTILGNGLSRFLITVGTILSANVLGVEKFGEFSITRSTINVILVISGLNIGTIITKTVAEFNDDDERRARLITLNYLIIISITIVLATLTFFFSELIAQNISNSSNLAKHFKISSSILIFAIIFSLNESIYRGLRMYKRLGVWQVLSSVSYLLFVPLGSFYFGVTGAIIGYLIYTVVMCCITIVDLIVISKKAGLKLLTFNKLSLEKAEIRKVTIPIFFSSIIEAPIFWLAQVILIKYVGMAANGVSSALLQTRNLILIIPGYIGLVVLPLLSKNLHNQSEYKRNLNQSLKLNALISIVCTLPLLIFPRFFLNIYGKDFIYDFSYWDSFFAYVSIPLVVISNIYQQSLLAKSEGWKSFAISIAWNLILILSTYILCNFLKLGVTGYMFSLLLSIVCQLMLRMFYGK